MSNEKDTTNKPLKRYRTFSLITYCNPLQVSSVLLKRDKQVRAYCYITHDKDLDELGKPKEVHIHLLLRLVNNSTVEAVRGWFKGFTDEKGQPINTLAQPLHDIQGSFDYLTHNTEQAKADGKYLYPEESLVSNDIDFWKDSALQEEDNLTLAFCELMNGTPLCEVAKKYGRDFIIHYPSIKLLMTDIKRETGMEL